MLRVIGVDDEKHALERFKRIVKAIPEVKISGLFDNCEQAFEFLLSHEVDAVFLDIEMPQGSGLEFSQRILELRPDIDIIFVTAYNQYAVEAFEIEALDYVLKPITEERLKKTLYRISGTKGAYSNNQTVMLQCFGRFTLWKDDKPLHCKNSKAEELLAFLVHHEGAAVKWEKIVDAIWPEFHFQKAHANFHSTTYLLRKFLAEHGLAHIMEYSRGQYRIRPDKINCDMFEFKKIFTQNYNHTGDISLREKISSLYFGGYLEENGYTWAYAKAAELERLYNKIL